MTKVQIRFRLERPLDETGLERIADAHAVYGITRVHIESVDRLAVEYDATRLSPQQVEATLRRSGLPVARLE
jgi:hypothetical protein